MSEQGRHQNPKLLEIEQVILDPIVSGFEGVVMQLEEKGGLYTLREISVCSGNRILTVTSRDESFIRDLFTTDLEGYKALQDLLLPGQQPPHDQLQSRTRRPT